MTRIFLALAALAVATPAMAQGWRNTTMPLGGGWQMHQGSGPNGQTYYGTTMPLGGGMSSSTFNDSSGRSTTCTTMPLGGGFTSTNCY